MPDTLSSGQTPFDTWINLIENTMKGNPAAQTVNKQDRGDAISSGGLIPTANYCLSILSR